MHFLNLKEATKQRRKVLRLTQADLAEMAGVAKRTVFQIENGTGNPTIEVLEKIMDVLGLKIAYLVKGTE